MGTPKNQFQVIATIDSNEEAFYTELNQEVLSNFRTGDWPRTGEGGNTVTVYQDWTAAIPERVKQGWGTYIYTAKKELGDGVIRFFWGKNKTETEKNTPFRTTPTFGNHYWPPILLSIDIQKSRVPRAVNVGNAIYRGNSYTATPIFIPSADTGTLFILREYLSATQFDIPQHPTLITGAVNFPVPGSAPFSFPECLHPDLPIEHMEDSESSYDPSSLTVSSNVGLTAPFFFPATDPKTWLPYFLYDRQTKSESGLWHRTQMEVHPPPLPRKRRGRAS